MSPLLLRGRCRVGRGLSAFSGGLFLDAVIMFAILDVADLKRANRSQLSSYASQVAALTSVFTNYTSWRRYGREVTSTGRAFGCLMRHVVIADLVPVARLGLVHRALLERGKTAAALIRKFTRRKGKQLLQLGAIVFVLLLIIARLLATRHT